MTHRKVNSQGSIPFSWEDKPGISKVTTKEKRPIDRSAQALDLTSSIPSSPSKQQSSLLSNGVKLVSVANDLLKIPPPPCASQPPSRSSSAKGLRWQEDPFLLAYKECTKSVKKGKDQNNKKGSRLKKGIFMYFSCNNSCEVRDDNFVRLSHLPALPRQKPENFAMENW